MSRFYFFYFALTEFHNEAIAIDLLKIEFAIQMHLHIHTQHISMICICCVCTNQSGISWIDMWFLLERNSILSKLFYIYKNNKLWDWSKAIKVIVQKRILYAPNQWTKNLHLNSMQYILVQFEINSRKNNEENENKYVFFYFKGII